VRTKTLAGHHGAARAPQRGSDKMRTLTIVLSLALLMAAAAPASADKCNGAKIKAVGKKESSLLSCSGKEATKGPSVQPDCNNQQRPANPPKKHNPPGAGRRRPPPTGPGEAGGGV